MSVPRPIRRRLGTRDVRTLAFDAFLIALGGAIIVTIVLIKSKTAADFFTDPLLLGYTFFVTLFQMSRIGTALMYRSSYDAVKEAAPQEPYTPAVSFVIPCMNEERAIYNTIANCFRAHYPRELMEVIVINDGSSDGTLAEIMRAKEEFPELIVIDWKKNRGKRHGMAEGFRQARGEIVIQLDSDSYIEPETFPAFVAPFRNPEVGAVSAHTDPMNPDENLLTKMQTAYYFMSFRILKAAESTFHMVFCCSGCASAYRKEAVMPILDEWLKETFLGLPVTWGDDRSITNQVLKRGYRTLYTDDVRAYTIVPNRFGQFLKQQIRWKKGWFVNSIKASGFIIRREPFVAFTYFFPLMFVTFLTPFMAARAFFYTPIVKGPSATVYYILGVLCITMLIMVVYRFVARENRYWPYLFVWASINMVLLSYLLFYALATIQDRRWNTRGAAAA
jgi:hyaluronan synthase